MTWIIGIVLLLAATERMEISLRIACVLGGVVLLAVDRVMDRLDQRAKNRDGASR